jgi:hypothetical protein
MSAFAVMVDTTGAGCDQAEFSRFVKLVANYKFLSNPHYITDVNYCGAKFDSVSSLHRKITVDPTSNSWLMAAGTVIDTYQDAPDGTLLVLLQDYLAQGPSVFARCDGLFALVIYNGITRTLAVVSDPFGYFSVFYGRRNGRVYISTSALAIAQQVHAQADELGVHCFLRTGKVFGPMTLWKDIPRVGQATVVEFDQEAIRETVYWQPTMDDSITKLSFDDTMEISINLVQQVLKRNLQREGKLWSDLTGGFDTRFLTMGLERASIPFKANFVGPAKHPDVKIAQIIVNKMGWEYQHFQLPPTWSQEAPGYLHQALGRGDGHLNVFLSLRPIWVHQQECSQYPALLSGLGGEMWRGPIWWPERAMLGKSQVVHYDRQLWSFMHPIEASIFASDSTQMVKNEIVRQFLAMGEREPDAPNTVKLDYLWTFRETAHVGVWASVAAGLVRIIPALFSKDIISHVISINYRWKLENRLVRHMFERYHPILANIEVEGRGPAVPRRFSNFHRFFPSRLAYYRKASNKFFEIKFGRSLWPIQRDEGYSRLEWRRKLLEVAISEGLFRMREMHTGNLYNFEQLQAFLADAYTDEFQHDEFLGRIITVEMALRATGSAIN